MPWNCLITFPFGTGLSSPTTNKHQDKPAAIADSEQAAYAPAASGCSVVTMLTGSSIYGFMRTACLGKLDCLARYVTKDKDSSRVVVPQARPWKRWRESPLSLQALPQRSVVPWSALQSERCLPGLSACLPSELEKQGYSLFSSLHAGWQGSLSTNNLKAGRNSLIADHHRPRRTALPFRTVGESDERMNPQTTLQLVKQVQTQVRQSATGAARPRCSSDVFDQRIQSHTTRSCGFGSSVVPIVAFPLYHHPCLPTPDWQPHY